ncbi:MAG: radical SAM protein [Polyangiaceae bacterium]
MRTDRFSVQLQLLDDCNLRCSHCYGAGDVHAPPPTTRELFHRIDRVVEFCAELRARPAFHLSGGEPTLRHDLPELVEHISRRHSCAALLMTNGLRMSCDYVRRLKSCGLAYVQVSLEGPEALNDEVRGRGAYRAAMRAIEMLIECGLRVTLSVTVTGRNYPELRDFVRNLDELAVHFHLREVMPIGRGVSCNELSPTQRRELYAWAIGYRGASTVALEDPIHCSIDPAYAAECCGCVAGVNHFCVDVDGAIYPCRPLRIPVGHIDALSEAWHSQTMDRIRRRDFDGDCGRCTLRGSCGGCRVHAMLGGSLIWLRSQVFLP